MPYNSIAESIHTKELYSRPSSSEVQFYKKNCRCAFWSPQGAYEQCTMFIFLRLIGKLVVDFMLVITELIH